MILYKYISQHTFEEFILKQINSQQAPSLSFSFISSLNDPFELTSLKSVVNRDCKGLTRFKNNVAINKHHCILSLTRTPTNKLMWSHYADGYNGVVIGIETENLNLDSSEFIIPVSYGSVIYCNEPSKTDFEAARSIMSSMTNSIEFSHENYHTLQSAFLTKSIEWSYEEEVRVVSRRKNLLNITGSKEHEKGISIPLPTSAIKELYFHKPQSIKTTANNVFRIRKEHKMPDTAFYKILVSEDDFKIIAKPIADTDYPLFSYLQIFHDQHNRFSDN